MLHHCRDCSRNMTVIVDSNNSFSGLPLWQSGLAHLLKHPYLILELWFEFAPLQFSLLLLLLPLSCFGFLQVERQQRMTQMLRSWQTLWNTKWNFWLLASTLWLAQCCGCLGHQTSSRWSSRRENSFSSFCLSPGFCCSFKYMNKS